jgi:uncharacterized protein YndB with AHSA1/START domain
VVAISELPKAAEPALVITRVFNAPRELVFAAWTQREHLMKWSCPHGFAITHCEGDLRVGGAWKTCMRAPNGVDHWAHGVYKEIVPPEKLVFTHGWLDPQPKAGHLTLVTIHFEAVAAGRTKMTFHQATFKSAGSRDGHRGGWTEAFERLEEYLSTNTGTCA